MAFSLGAALGVASGLTGLFGKSGSSTATGTSKAISKLLEQSANTVRNTDPYADVEKALKTSQLSVEDLAQRALQNVFAQFASNGSRSDLPDSARSGVLRGVLSDILNERFNIEADARMNALPRYVDMVSRIVGQAAAGRGENQTVKSNFNVSAFGKDVDALINSLKK